MNLTLLPVVILALGAIILSSFFIVEEHYSRVKNLVTSQAFLVTSLLAMLFIKIPSPQYAFRGGVVLDGTNQALSVIILFLFVVVGWAMSIFEESQNRHSQVLAVLFCFFAIISVLSNRFLFSVTAILGLIFAAQAWLVSDLGKDLQVEYSGAALRKIFIYLLLVVGIATTCFIYFGEAQYDEIQVFLNRTKTPLQNITLLQILFLVHVFFVLGASPLSGLLSTTRRAAPWMRSFCVTTVFALVAVALFIKTIIFISTRVGVGSQELEVLSESNIFFISKTVLSVSLISSPLLALFQKNIKQSLLIMIVNGFLQILFALTYMQKEIMGLAAGAIIQIVLGAAILMLSKAVLNLNNYSKLEDWIGVGHQRSQTLLILVAVWSLTGLPPFFTGILNQKTLCINSEFSPVLLINMFLSGCYALRLTALAYQEPAVLTPHAKELSKKQQILPVLFALLLILLGIFSQPLYKYGAYSIRHLFGEF